MMPGDGIRIRPMERHQLPIKPQPTRYAVTLQALPGDSRPAAVRLRQFLKAARRAWGLACVGIVQEGGTGPEGNEA